MEKPAIGSQTTLQIRRIFHAPREKVFAAWTQQRALEQWMCRDVPTHRVNYVTLEMRKGGRYKMEVVDATTSVVYIGQGVYQEVTPPERLAFTWGWTKKQLDGSEIPVESETVVTVEFNDRGGLTEVVLTQVGFETTKARAETERGWEGCFDVLAAYMK
jgi:uncharacterized protein YndB with AHSA1/START domain